jgi:hypothetical protein
MTWQDIFKGYENVVEYHQSFGELCLTELKHPQMIVGIPEPKDYEIILTFYGHPRIHPLPTNNGFKVTFKVIEKLPGTDFEEWYNHFKKFKVDFTIQKDDKDIHLSTESGEGYGGFTFVAIFDLSGKFLKYGVWE